MGRAKKLKDQRAMRRLFEGALKLEAQEAKKPCADCAFRDPGSWVFSTMRQDIQDCLTKPGHRFVCHEGMSMQTRLDGSEGAYLPPKTAEGKIDASHLTPCGGFLRWAVKYRFASLAEQIKAVAALQLHMLQRFLQSDDLHAWTLRDACDNRAEVLQRALNSDEVRRLLEEGV